MKEKGDKNWGNTGEKRDGPFSEKGEVSKLTQTDVGHQRRKGGGGVTKRKTFFCPKWKRGRSERGRNVRGGGDDVPYFPTQPRKIKARERGGFLEKVYKKGEKRGGREERSQADCC